MPIGVYLRTEYHKNIARKNGFQKGQPSVFKGKKHSKKTKKKMSIIVKQHWQNPEYRKHMSEIHKGQHGYWTNKKRPEMTAENSPSWKGGRRKHAKGYIWVYKPNHPFCDSHKCVFEHRLIMEQMLGRYLTKKEVVHHINKITNDNRIKNLMLIANTAEHTKMHPENGRRKHFKRK